MRFAFFEQRVVAFVAAFVFVHPVFRELAGLNIFQRRRHALLHAGINNFWTDADVAPLGGFGNREPHAADAGFVHQIGDEFQFMQALEVGHLRRVAGFDEHFKSGLHQSARAAAEHGLFAEQIGFRLFLEISFEDAGARAANAFGPGERNFFRILAGVLDRKSVV